MPTPPLETEPIREDVVPTSSPRAPALLKVNLGCGHVQPAGWVNVDGSNRAWLASHLPLVDRLLMALRLLSVTEFNAGTVWANLQRRFPWPDNSVDAIYMGEILEHFTREAGRRVLEECHRVLRPGGVLRIRVPDNARFWSNYLAEYNQMKQRPRSEWTTAHARWVEMFFRDICVRPRPLRYRGHYHKWMYDDISLIKTLEECGFRDVERAAYHESRIPDIASVEVRDDLIVEAAKPSAPEATDQAPGSVPRK